MRRPGFGHRHHEIESLLAHLSPLAVDSAQWPGSIGLAISAYAGDHAVPAELVSSIRCLVTVGHRVVVCEDVTPSTHVLPGGRCEARESWAETALREVYEETGWRLIPETLTTLGFIHFRHLSPMPEEHPYPHPDFLQVVMHGEAKGEPEDWVDVDGWVVRSWLASLEEARALPLSASGRAFLDLRLGK